MATNLPRPVKEDSAEFTKLFFDTYGQAPLEFNSVDVDACINFFVKRGFDQDAALSVATVILKQAKLEATPVGQILDSLTGFQEIQISALVSEILNNNRVPTSALGFKTVVDNRNIVRNILV
jgi:hypothetical protein